MFDETTRKNLIKIAAAYAEAEDVPLSTVSKRAYGHVGFFDMLANGSDPRIGTVEGLLEWFRANWPRCASWPTGLRNPHMGRSRSRIK